MPLLEDLYAQQRAREVELDPFNYSTDFNTIAGATTASQNISIQADSDFVMRYVSITAFTTAPAFQANPHLLISFFDSGSGRSLQDNPQHVGNVSGGWVQSGGSLPFIWAEPKLFSGSSVITVTLQNLTAATTMRVFVNLHGFKVFYFKKTRRG